MSSLLTLVLIRHAEAEPWATEDIQRSLTPRGADAAGEAGDWLRERGIRPERALVSSAVRTQQTWSSLSARAGWTVVPEIDPGIYTAGPDTVVDLVRLADEGVTTQVVLGHNPTIHYLAQLLCDGQGDPDAEASLLIGFPPASVAILEFDVPWSRVNEGYGRLVAVRPGRH